MNSSARFTLVGFKFHIGGRSVELPRYLFNSIWKHLQVSERENFWSFSSMFRRWDVAVERFGEKANIIKGLRTVVVELPRHPLSPRRAWTKVEVAALGFSVDEVALEVDRRLHPAEHQVTFGARNWTKNEGKSDKIDETTSKKQQTKLLLNYSTRRPPRYVRACVQLLICLY